MRSAFEYVIWIVCGIGIVVAFVALLGSGKAWDDYGKRGLVMDTELARGGARAAPSSGTTAERDEEIRQLLEARNARRARRGEAPVDVERELQRLVTPRIDDALRAEIRELVVARNYRRLRQGKEPLDVDAEVERQIAELPPA